MPLKAPETAAASPPSQETFPVLPTAVLALAGLALAAVSALFYASLTWRAAREGRTTLDLAGTLSQGVLEAGAACQIYLASGDAKSARDYGFALDRSRKAAEGLSAAAGRLHLGEITLGPAVRDTMRRLEAWEESYAGPAMALKRSGQSQKLSALNRRGAGATALLGLRDSLEAFRRAASAAVSQNSARAEFLGNACLGTGIAGLLLLAGAAAFLYRRARSVLGDLRSNSEALELLAHWAERIQHSFSDDQAARTLAGTITRQLGMSRTTIFLREAGTDELRVAADIPTKPGAVPAEARDANACPILTTGQPIFCDKSDGLHPCPQCPLNNDIKGGFLCVPLTAQGGVVGVVRAEGSDGRPLRPSVVQRIESLVRLTSITLNTLLSLADAKQQATTDGLTGVFNRRFLDAYLEKQVQVAARHGQHLSVLMMDLDKFKDFNDRYGHAAGDALLRTFAVTMARSVRDGDLAARYGGEEFTAVLANTNCAEAGQTAERIRAAVEGMKLDILPHLELPVMTVSIGAACLPHDGQTAAELLAAADNALYKAKEGGRNRVVLASPES